MENIQSKTKREVDDLGKAFDKAKQQTYQAKDEVMDKAEDAWNDAKSNGNEVWENAKSKGKEIWDEVTSRGGDGWQTVRRTIQRKPEQALGIAVVAGVILGAFFFARSRRED